jgi:uncharacterized protein
MRTQPITDHVDIHHVDLDELDNFLTSRRTSPNAMMLSELDGFLTGIAIGPELVMPSEWLPLIWRDEAPKFADQDEANAILGAIMDRYNEILREIAEDRYGPIFWTDSDETAIAIDWAEGFLKAMVLRADAWKRLIKSKRDGALLYPMLALCSDENDESLLGLAPEEDDRMFEAAPDLIPGCVMEIAAYWRGKGPKQVSMPLGASPLAEPLWTAPKVGRNDPCPCGSGKKFKRCCAKTV